VHLRVEVRQVVLACPVADLDLIAVSPAVALGAVPVVVLASPWKGRAEDRSIQAVVVIELQTSLGLRERPSGGLNPRANATQRGRSRPEDCFSLNSLNPWLGLVARVQRRNQRKIGAQAERM
jgi:hypothetical protein